MLWVRKFVQTRTKVSQTHRHNAFEPSGCLGSRWRAGFSSQGLRVRRGVANWKFLHPAPGGRREGRVWEMYLNMLHASGKGPWNRLFLSYEGVQNRAKKGKLEDGLGRGAKRLEVVSECKHSLCGCLLLTAAPCSSLLLSAAPYCSLLLPAPCSSGSSPRVPAAPAAPKPPCAAPRGWAVEREGGFNSSR